ncbi:Sphingosine Transfer Protein ACD11 homolog [Klebsormidium nitens]|uniref:Sphingosine Transfer Protein ACD11 homolog n=1 Tax=Klebsormidium nitens TaxID=105231 RepID=A0A1Y1I3M3_KLENI|nr:Sphingosine Transfer Protein ACD11 homolog [Klebsormidium nitens]|eukprot:GAQ85540.1 Sphingosine Transfer Protein ACD11 homolog [Klebsormidium nitens]
MSGPGEGKVLPELGLAFKGVADLIKQNAEVPTAAFAAACDKINPIFGHLGMAFKFARDDFVTKVEDLKECAKDLPTLEDILDADIKAGTVREPGSHTRNLLRVTRGINMIRLLFEHLLSSDGVSLKEAASKASFERDFSSPQNYGVSLKEAASKAYEQALAPHHSWAIRQAVRASLYTLPSREKFLARVGEDEFSWRPYAQEFVNDSDPVIKYVISLYVDKGIGTDW